MAQVSLSSGSICRPLRSPWGAFPIKHMIPISSGAQIYPGQPVTLDYTANSTNVGKVKASSATATFHLVGIAAAGSTMSTGVEPQPIPIWECNPNVEYVANTKEAVTASSIIGMRKSLVWDSTLNIAYVDMTDATAANLRVVVTGLNGVNGVTGLQGELGDSGAQVTFRFLNTLAGAGGSTVVSSTPLLAFYS